MPQADTESTTAMHQIFRGGVLSFRSAYSKFSLVLLAISVITLMPQYAKILAPTVTVSAQMIAHGALFLSWFILFSIQSALVSARQTALHKKLGYLSIALAIVLVYSGTTMLLDAIHAFNSDWSEQFLYSRISLIWGIYHTLASFICFYSLAVLFRKKSQVHKRFMLLACLCMMSASITRVAYLPIVPIDGTALTLLSTHALLITPLVIDRVQQKRIHPVMKWGVPVYVVTQMLTIMYIPATDIGRALTFQF